MKKIYILNAIMLVILLVGCAQSKRNDVPVQILDRGILAKAKILRVDTIGVFDDFIYAKNFWVYADSVLVVLNKKHKDGHFVELYNLYTKENIAKLYRLGDAPNEMLSARIDMNGKTMFVNDYVKGQIAVVDLDSLLRNATYTALPVRHQVMGSPTAIPYGDCFLLEHPYRFTDKNLKIEQDAPRFIVTDGKKPYVEKVEYKYYTRNVSVDGCIITNYSNDRIIYAYMHKSVMEIYDKDLNLRRMIEGPVDLKARYSLDGGLDTGTEISFKDYIPYAYLTYCTAKNCFYMSYVGDYLKSGRGMKDFPGWILKFDWDGKLLDCFSVNGCVRSVSKSEKERALYVTVLNKEDVPILLRMYENEG